MRSGRNWMLVAAWITAMPAVAIAQDQGCTYEGERYAEGTTICQGGLRQTCMNGTWQSLDGGRCGGADDGAVEAVEGVEVNPQGGFE